MSEQTLLFEVEKCFGVRASAATLLRHNENRTYRLDAPEGSYALRIHQPVEGFSLGPLGADVSPLALLRRETALLDFLWQGGLPVQQPVHGENGEAVCTLEGAPATLQRWLIGTPLSNLEMDDRISRRMGGMVARLHALLRAFDREHPQQGYRYDEKLLARLAASLRQAAREGAMPPDTVRALEDTLCAIAAHMRRLGPTQTVYADLSRGNLLLCGGDICPIDFSLNGRCHTTMDIAALLAQDGTPRRAAILRGYESESGAPVSLADVEPYFALQILLFVACQWPRFAREGWFAEALTRWQSQTFGPLARGERFLTA